jgi:hypothetical protein
MGRALRAGAAYFAVVFAFGFVLGTIRTLFVAPNLGELVAVAIEVPAMLVASWWACGWLLRRFAVAPRAADRWAMGGLALALLLAAEVGVSVLLAGRSVQQHFALYAELPAQIGLAAQLLFAAMPALRRRA